MTKLTKEDKKRYKKAQGNNISFKNCMFYLFYFIVSTSLFVFSGTLKDNSFQYGSIIVFLLGLLFSYLLQMNILNPMYVMMKKAEDGELLCKKQN